METNKFEHTGQFAEGCTSGVHLLGDDPVLVIDGELTKFVSTCKRCNAKIEVSADLKLNKYLGQPQSPSPQKVDTKESSQSNTPEEIDPLVRELLGLR